MLSSSSTASRNSKAEHLSSSRRNLVILVTARLVNPGGQMVNSNEDTEESEDLIEPPILPEVPSYIAGSRKRPLAFFLVWRARNRKTAVMRNVLALIGPAWRRADKV